MNNENIFALKGNIIWSESSLNMICKPAHYAVCENGKCVGIFETLPERFLDITILDYDNALIIPGLTDLHVHAPQYSYRGFGMDLELLEWLNTNIFPEEAKYKKIEYARKAYEIFVSDLAAGATTRACVFATQHPQSTELLMDLIDKSGIKAMVGKVNMDRNSPDFYCESTEGSLKDTTQWIAHTKNRYKNVKPIITPRFIPSCTDDLMNGLSKIHKESGLCVQSHLSENLSEIAWVGELCPDSDGYADAYDRFELFDSTTIMAHCVHCTDKELSLMKKRRIFVAHCPQSNANLSSGIAPVRSFINSGIHTGLGSDVAGGTGLSIFRAMSDAIQMSKMRWRHVDSDLKPLTLPEAFFLATRGGGEFFGKVGAFENGFEFDAVVIDDTRLKTPLELTPLERLERVVYLSDEREIVDKYICGTKITRSI